MVKKRSREQRLRRQSPSPPRRRERDSTPVPRPRRQPTALPLRATPSILDDDILPQPIAVPLLVRGSRTTDMTQRALGALDTYALTSCVSLDLVRRLELERRIMPPAMDEPQVLALACDNVSVPRRGTVILEILARDVTPFQHAFEVIDGADDLLLGPDVMAKVGIAIHGLPSQFPDDQPGRTEARQAQEAEEELHRRRVPWTAFDQVDPEVHQWFTTSLEDLVRPNLELDPREPACSTIPESIMQLPLSAPWSFRHQYNLPHAAWGAVKQEFQAWVANGVIEPGDPKSDYNTPIVVAAKKDLSGRKTGYRVCMDFRHINLLLLQDYAHARERMPHLHEALGRLRGFDFCSTIDLRSAYAQFEIAPEDRDKTTFTYNNKRWRWKRWPFGLSPATAKFQKTMEIVMEGLDVVIWIDDLCVYTKGSIEDHLELVREVMRRLNKHKLRINIDKCHFAYTRVLILGHFISGSTRAMDPLKAQQILDWPEPTTDKAVHRLLGFTNFIRDYIPLYAQITAPLERLKNIKKFKMEGAQLRAFHTLRRVINTAPVLSQPDYKLPFIVATDASQTGLGAVLYQEMTDEDGTTHRRYVAFASTSLKGAQQNYPATKRELLGITFALNQFHDFIFGTKFVLYTDHQALTTLYTKKKLSYMMANWLDTILNYDFEIRHRPGVLMVLPDALSRLYGDSDNPNPPAPAGRTAVALKKLRHRGQLRKRGWEVVQTVEPPREHYVGDTIRLRRVPKARLIEEGHRVTIDELPLWPDDELAEFISERHLKTTPKTAERDQLLRTAHADGHFGADNLFKAVWRAGYYWEGLRKACQTTVGRCRACLQYNVGREGFHPVKSLQAERVWDHVALDTCGEFPVSQRGNRYILVLVDVRSRFLVTRPIPDTKMETVARALYEVFTQFGPPKVLQTDNGPEYINKLVKQLCEEADIDHRTVAEYNPRANGLAERFVRAVKEALKKKLAGEFNAWDAALPGLTLAINRKDSARHLTAPFTLFYGREANGWTDYELDTLQLDANEEEVRAAAITAINQVFSDADERQDAANEKLNTKRKIVTRHYPVGATVFLLNDSRTAKIEPKWIGPFRVSSNAHGNYVLEDTDGELLYGKSKTKPRKVPISKLKWVSDQAVRLFDASGNTVAIDQAHGRGIVKNILQADEASKQTKYLVQWSDPSETNQWLTADAFDDPSAIAQYWRSARPGKKRGRLQRNTMKVHDPHEPTGPPKKKRRKAKKTKK